MGLQERRSRLDRCLGPDRGRCRDGRSPRSCFSPVVIILSGVLLVAGGGIAILFLREPSTRLSKAIEALSGVWTLFMYLNLGVVPLVWRWWASGGEVPS